MRQFPQLLKRSSVGFGRHAHTPLRGLLDVQAVAQFALDDFAVGIARQRFLDEPDVARNLERGDVLIQLLVREVGFRKSMG